MKPGLKEPDKNSKQAPKAETPKAETPKAETPKKHYPDVRVGDMVYWYFAGDPRNGAIAAIVTMIRGQGNLCLTVLSTNGMEVYDGVKHKDDPSLNENHRIRTGCWGSRD